MYVYFQYKITLNIFFVNSYLSLGLCYRGNGFGKILVNEAFKGVKEKQCDEMYLEVRCSNTEAVKLYQDLGMDIRQRLKSYYRDGEDAYMMAIEF